MTPAQKLQIVTKVGEIVVAKHVAPEDWGYDYDHWRGEFNARARDFCNGTDADFEKGVLKALAELGTSHVGFTRQQSAGVPSTFAINAGLMPIDEGKRWMFRDIVEDGPAHRAGIANGDILVAVNGQSVSPPDPVLFTLGESNSLTIRHYDGSAERNILIDLPKVKSKGRPMMVEPKAVSTSYLGSGVGHLRVSYFPGAVGYGFIKNLDTGIQSLVQAGACKFVLDLRGNPGGGLGSLRLMSLLAAAPVPVGYSLTRRAIQKTWTREQLPQIDRIPVGRLEQIGMFLKFKVLNRDRSITLVTENIDRSPLAGATVLLVNNQTRSAAEMVAAFVREHRLAQIVGQGTPGEVLGAVNFKLPEDYRLRLPIATWKTWDGTVIEGRGIEPDFPVTLDPVELAHGADTQLEQAVELCHGQ